MAVLMKNCTVVIKRGSDGTEIIPQTKGNIQKVSDEKVPAQFQGVAIDQRPSFRIRVNLPRDVDDLTRLIAHGLPTQGDIAIVEECRNMPYLFGRWEILRMEPDTGSLASIVLFVKRPTDSVKTQEIGLSSLEI